jgi:hypothetical protein
MTDMNIVWRLRRRAKYRADGLAGEAADEIERLLAMAPSNAWAWAERATAAESEIKRLTNLLSSKDQQNELATIVDRLRVIIDEREALGLRTSGLESACREIEWAARQQPK